MARIFANISSSLVQSSFSLGSSESPKTCSNCWTVEKNEHAITRCFKRTRRPLFQSKCFHQYPFLHYLWQQNLSVFFHLHPVRLLTDILLLAHTVCGQDDPKNIGASRASSWTTSSFDLSKCCEIFGISVPKRSTPSTSIIPLNWRICATSAWRERTAHWHISLSLSKLRLWTATFSHLSRNYRISEGLSHAPDLLVVHRSWQCDPSAGKRLRQFMSQVFNFFSTCDLLGTSDKWRFLQTLVTLPLMPLKLNCCFTEQTSSRFPMRRVRQFFTFSIHNVTWWDV